MSKILQAVRGMNDLLPGQIGIWQSVERTARHVLHAYGYREIRLPLLEKTEVFSRSIGQFTDIVEKEMYSFEDRNGESLTLRPEGTAGCVRAGIESGLLHNQVQRFWYTGPMFRRERPQKGRYRQFHQVGVEAFGMPGPDIDVELILLCARLWIALGMQDTVKLQINSLGSQASRTAYRRALVDYFQKNLSSLDDDSRHRLEKNPLRILDSKNPEMASVIANAPSLPEHLDEPSREHFSGLCSSLQEAGVGYDINPRLVRGLDYYNGTVFEWVTDRLGAQSAVCAGGRFDGLVQLLGGKATPAIGFALGLERLIELLRQSGRDANDESPHVTICMLGTQAERQGQR